MPKSPLAMWSRLLMGGMLVVGLCFACGQALAISPAWTGAGRFRLLVEVAPAAIGDRADEMAADCELPLQRLLLKQGIEQSVDLASFQVQKFNPLTGVAEQGPTFRPARSLYDRPCRFEDDQLPAAYPGRVGRSSETTDGRAGLVVRPRKARLFNRQMSNEHGRLIWSHRQESNKVSHYAVYFDALPNRQSWGISPAPWIGDADVLRQEQGESLGGFSHFSTTVGDLNGDGLFDVVAGTEKGDLFWFANRGQPGQPRFLGCQVIQDELGPIDTGWYAAPFLYDWDGDGLLDLLVGTSGNVILWWRGIDRQGDEVRFRFMGFVQADGKRLEVPESPVAEDEHGIFAHDYFNQPWIGDMDGDGLPDIVTGGYTTGRIFWFRGTSRSADGTPLLSYVGPLDTEKGPIDTTWAAAPCCGDVNGDGRTDLLTGAWWWSGIPAAPPAGASDLLMFYVGEKSKGPRFKRTVFPHRGEFPSGSIARPSLVDVNGDGLSDLFVSESGGNAYIFANIGTTQTPRWETTGAALTVPWGFTRDFDVAAATVSLGDNGTKEYMVGNEVWSIGGASASPSKTRLGTAHVRGKPIHHSGPGYGDPYYFSQLCHWDNDAHADILWGTQQGNVYLHKNLASTDRLAFADGVLLRLTDGQPLRVGPPVVASPKEVTDFTILQGSRIVFTFEDFDGDGIRDLIVGETFGNSWVFRGTKELATDAFEPGVLIAKLPTRPEAIACTDWNRDGSPDLFVGGTAEEPAFVYLNRSKPGHPDIESGKPLKGLPYLFWGPKLRAADWNGDGDIDLLVQSEFFSFWIERSFLEHGYRTARVVSAIEEAPAEVNNKVKKSQ